MMTLHVVNAILIALSAAVLLPIAAFCVECLAALFPRKKPKTSPSKTRLRTAVLIPAHNEQLVIEHTLQAIIPTMPMGDRVLVVADNCDDQTAELAQRAGAEVIKRNDRERRGKGFALQCGIEVLRKEPPDAVVIIDADCLVEPQTIDTLVQLACRTQRPVQGRNLTDRNPATGTVQVVSIFGNRVINLIRPLGLLRLGAPCRLMGTGMAIPWPLAQDMQLAGGHLVEDMQLGIDLTLQGHFPLFCPEAGVTSGLPNADQAFVSQRTRWEHGHLRTAATQIPRLFMAAVRQRRWSLLAMAIDLSIPPLTLLVALWLTATVFSGLAGWLLGASWLPLALLASGGAALAISLGLSWAAFCRWQVPPKALAAVPIYILRKLPIYARFLFHRQHTWVRTERAATTTDRAPAPKMAYTSGDDTERHNNTDAGEHTPHRSHAAAALRSGRPYP